MKKSTIPSLVVIGVLLIFAFGLALYFSSKNKNPSPVSVLPTPTEDVAAKNKAFEEKMHSSLFEFAKSKNHSDAVIISNAFFMDRGDEYTYTFQTKYEKKYIAYYAYDWDIVNRNNVFYLITDDLFGHGAVKLLLNADQLNILMNYKPDHTNYHKVIYVLAYINSIDNNSLILDASGNEDDGYTLVYSNSECLSIVGDCVEIQPADDSK